MRPKYTEEATQERASANLAREQAGKGWCGRAALAQDQGLAMGSPSKVSQAETWISPSDLTAHRDSAERDSHTVQTSAKPQRKERKQTALLRTTDLGGKAVPVHGL